MDKIFEEMNNIYEDLKDLEKYDEYMLYEENFKLIKHQECDTIQYKRYYEIPWCNMHIKLLTTKNIYDKYNRISIEAALRIDNYHGYNSTERKIEKLHEYFNNNNNEHKDVIIESFENDIKNNKWFDLSMDDIEKLLEKYCVDTIEEFLLKQQYDDSGLL